MKGGGGLTQRNENKIDANYGVLDLSVRVPLYCHAPYVMQTIFMVLKSGK